jgi:outer membrane protein OmpA-like peptidoglycan-associated protein
MERMFNNTLNGMEKTILKVCITSFLWILANGSYAGNLHYEAELHESTWKTTSSTLLCTLTHKVKLFGVAEFYQKAGYQMGFRFNVEQAPVRKGRATLKSIPPSWKHDVKAFEIGSVSYRKGETPFEFKRKLAVRTLYELEQGMLPTLFFKDWGDGRDNVEAVLSTVNFRDSLGKFRACLAKLIPYDFEKIRDTRIYFATAKFKLTDRQKQQLKGVIAYLNRDPSIKRVTIDGHADVRGTHIYNNDLSQKRAMAVRDYLLSQKVPEKKMVVKYHGKRKPFTSKRTKKALSLNRRVRLQLFR